METVDVFIQAATRFYTQQMEDENGRYRSWEYCYLSFNKARNSESVDVDYLCLQLAFYLASWGMYRGSSFLLQKDYKIHIPVVKEILKKKYNPLFAIDCVELKKESIQLLLKELNDFISNYYDNIRRSVKEQELKSPLSFTLITKILMGTMGCVPAYDRYFIDGIKKQKVAAGSYSKNSLHMLVDFYESNFEKLEKVRMTLNVSGLLYPQMKLIDMGFWQLGFDADENKGYKMAH